MIGSKTKKLVESQPMENVISLDDDDINTQPAFLNLPSPESQEGWYPTLRTTLWVLSCLWTYVDVSLDLPLHLSPCFGCFITQEQEQEQQG